MKKILGFLSCLFILHANAANIRSGGAATVCSDLSDASTSCSTDTTNASNITSGTLNAARLPAAINPASIGATTPGTVKATTVNIVAPSIGGVTIPNVSASVTNPAFARWTCGMQTEELGLSLVDRGYAPAWTSGASVRNQILNANPLYKAIERMGCSGNVLTSAGKSGDTIAGTLARINADVFSAVPAPVFVWDDNGGNDINTITTSNITSVLGTMMSGTVSAWQAIQAAGMGFGIEMLPYNSTWESDSQAAKLTSIGAQNYARHNSYWQWYRAQKEAARLNNLQLINWASGYSYPARQVPIAGTSDTVASTSTTANFTIPPSSATSPATVSITMTSTASFAASDFIFIKNGATVGVYQVQSVTDGTHLVAINSALAQGNTLGGTMNSGATVTMCTVTTSTPNNWSTANEVFNYTIAPVQQLVASALPIHSTGASTFTYPCPATNTVTTQGSWQRGAVQNLLATDGIIHWNANGAFQLSYPAYQALAFGVQNYLDFTEEDSQNITGAGTAGTDYETFNRGAMQGTTGTFTSITNTSGTVPTGWDVKQLAGPSGGTASCSTVTSPDPGHPLLSRLRCTFTAASGTTDTEFSIHIAHTLPTAWAATHAQTLSDWIIPATAPAGLFYVDVQTGSCTTGGSEPVWPTNIGIQVADGSCTWEARQGYIADSTTKYHLGAYFELHAASSATALQSRAFGLWDDTTTNNNIIDGDALDNVPGPNYQVGEIVQLFTTDATLGTSTTTFDEGLRMWVTQGTNVTIDFGDATWERAGCGTGCNPSTYGSLGGF